MRCPTLKELPPPPPGKIGWPWTEESPPLPDTMPDGRPWPRVSIVTPSYNQGQFIEETIRSVLLQGYPDLEYIIIDGGSTDGSVDIIRKYEPWLAYWVSEPDKGQADAINKGWMLSKGEIITYLNSDDTLQASAVSRAVASLQQHPEAEFVFGSCNLMNYEGKVFITLHPSPFNITQLAFGNCFCQQTVFFRRQVLDKIGMLDMNFHFAFDYEFWLRAGLQGLVFVKIPPPPLANFRQWAGAKSWREYEKYARERLAIVDKHFPKKDESYLGRVAWAGAFHDAAWFYYASGQTWKALESFLKSLQVIPKTFLLKQSVKFLFLFLKIVLWTRCRQRFVGSNWYLCLGGLLNWVIAGQWR